MIDIHSHILYDVDDGIKTIDEAEKVIKQAVKNGVTAITLTPHYNNKYHADNKEKLKKFNLLKEHLEKENIDINLFLGNEVLETSNIIELIDNATSIKTINESKYLLLELSKTDMNPYLDNLIIALLNRKIIPVIAHLERYPYFRTNFYKVRKYYNMGVLFQSNLITLDKAYGNKSYLFLLYLLRHNYVHVMASDAHNLNGKHSYKNINKLQKHLQKIVGEKKSYELLVKNPTKIINDENIINNHRNNNVSTLKKIIMRLLYGIS